ncbi:hypothetical protein FrEUN1fDRAFT_7714, partial [Parafrankia sp. EUN1f]
MAVPGSVGEGPGEAAEAWPEPARPTTSLPVTVPPVTAIPTLSALERGQPS